MLTKFNVIKIGHELILTRRKYDYLLSLLGKLILFTILVNFLAEFFLFFVKSNKTEQPSI